MIDQFVAGKPAACRTLPGHGIEFLNQAGAYSLLFFCPENSLMCI
jgi:hypothetical protein